MTNQEPSAEEIGYAIYTNDNYDVLQNISDEGLYQGIKAATGEASSETTRAQLKDTLDRLRKTEINPNDPNLEIKKRLITAWNRYESETPKE